MVGTGHKKVTHSNKLQAHTCHTSAASTGIIKTTVDYLVVNDVALVTITTAKIVERPMWSITKTATHIYCYSSDASSHNQPQHRQKEQDTDGYQAPRNCGISIALHMHSQKDSCRQH